MRKFTANFSNRLKLALSRVTVLRRGGDARVIREARFSITAECTPRPRLPLFESGKPALAEHADQAPDGFVEA